MEHKPTNQPTEGQGLSTVQPKVWAQFGGNLVIGKCRETYGTWLELSLFRTKEKKWDL